VPLSDISDLTGYIANPGLILNLRKQDGAANLLANPRIRVKNKEKAKVHIGEKLPVFTTTSTANVGVSASVTYLDVGLKLDVEPLIHLEDRRGHQDDAGSVERGAGGAGAAKFARLSDRYPVDGPHRCA
jgi:hypothetical protein